MPMECIQTELDLVKSRGRKIVGAFGGDIEPDREHICDRRYRTIRTCSVPSSPTGGR